MVQPKPAASSISSWMWEPITNNFFGTQPRITQVPPIRYSSATITLAPWLAAMRAARTPPEPPPMTNRSTSNSAISNPARSQHSQMFSSETCPGTDPGVKPVRANKTRQTIVRACRLQFNQNLQAGKSDRLAALAHLGAEFGIDHLGELLRPLVHVDHAGLDRLWLAGQKFLPERRL